MTDSVARCHPVVNRHQPTDSTPTVDPWQDSVVIAEEFPVEEFRRRLNQVIEKKGLTNREVAKAAKMDHTYLSRLRGGPRPVKRIGMSIVTKLATALNTPTEWLTGKVDNETDRSSQSESISSSMNTLDAALEKFSWTEFNLDDTQIDAVLKKVRVSYKNATEVRPVAFWLSRLRILAKETAESTPKKKA
jgi:transcriptional regulator with XRE-family HTH domain